MSEIISGRKKQDFSVVYERDSVPEVGELIFLPRCRFSRSAFWKSLTPSTFYPIFDAGKAAIFLGDAFVHYSHETFRTWYFLIDGRVMKCYARGLKHTFGFTGQWKK